MAGEIDKVWEIGTIQPKEKDPDRENKRRKHNRQIKKTDTIFISEEARNSWESIGSVEGDAPL